MGLYNHHKAIGPSSSLVPCSDACGVVVGIGDGTQSSPWAIGDRVLSIFNQTHLTGQIQPQDMASGLGLPRDGVLQTYRVFPTQGLVKAHDYLSDEEACTLPIAGVTAWMAINGMRPMGHPGGKGETILIQGTGGVAISGLQIAHAAGAESKLFCAFDSWFLSTHTDPVAVSNHHLLVRCQTRPSQIFGCHTHHQLPGQPQLARHRHENHQRSGRGHHI